MQKWLIGVLVPAVAPAVVMELAALAERRGLVSGEQRDALASVLSALFSNSLRLLLASRSG